MGRGNTLKARCCDGSGFLLQVTMNEEIIKSAQHQHCAAEPNGDSMQFALHQLLVLAHFDSDVTKHRTPDAGTEDGEEGEEFVIHTDDAGGNSDKMPH